MIIAIFLRSVQNTDLVRWDDGLYTSVAQRAERRKNGTGSVKGRIHRKGLKKVADAPGESREARFLKFQFSIWTWVQVPPGVPKQDCRT